MPPVKGISPGNPMHFELSVRGIAQINNELTARYTQFVGKLQNIVKMYGESTQQLTAFLSPVDTTYMQTHVKVFYTPDKLSFEVGWDVMDFVAIGEPFYPFFQEFGTIRNRAQPSLRPAFESQAPLFQADIRKLVEEHWEHALRATA